jgi:hypothetical protein
MILAVLLCRAAGLACLTSHSLVLQAAGAHHPTNRPAQLMPAHVQTAMHASQSCRPAGGPMQHTLQSESLLLLKIMVVVSFIQVDCSYGLCLVVVAQQVPAHPRIAMHAFLSCRKAEGLMQHTFAE